MTSMKHWLLIRLAGLMAAALCSIPALAQHDLPGGGWTYDPAKDGMKDLRALKPIEGCLAPGGLVKITSTDEPGVSAPYWCGKPPFCLTDAATPLGEQCTILPYSRRNPRYDPNGAPGANGVRNPQDLRCVNTGLMPIAGRCPLPPELSAAINPGTVQVNTDSVLTISSPHATSLAMSCAGSNSAFPPYNQSNLNAFAGKSQTFESSRAMLTGVTTCTIRASNARGSKDATVSFNATAAAPAPTVTANFNPTKPTAGGTVQLTTRTTNATSLRWSCSGRWTNSNTGRAVGTITTNHTASGSAGTANCTFSAAGPGGTATAAASWTSVAGSGGGSGSGSGNGEDLPTASTYHFNICVKEAANGGNGGGCFQIYWYPRAPYGNCSWVSPPSTQPGYAAALASARSHSIISKVTSAKKCSH